MKSDSPAAQLATLIARYSPEVARVARAALTKMRRRLPGAVELVYDNYNALVIAFGPTEKRGDLVLSIVLYPRWVSMFFTKGAELRDPKKLLKGSGKTYRHLVLASARDLDRREVDRLITDALDKADVPIDRAQKNRTIIRAIVAKQRPRRPSSRTTA
jgi:hypothetical protein